VLNLLHLMTLRAVVEGGSFSAGARALGYTSSAVSQQISALERATGLVLFDRTPRSTRPTRAALLLVERSEEVLAALERVESEVELLRAGDSGRISVGSFGTANRHIMPLALADFMAAYPGVSLHLEEARAGTLWPQLLSGELDVVLTHHCAGARAPWPDGVMVQSLLSEELLLLVPGDSRLAAAARAGRGAVWADLTDEHWISSSRNGQHDQTLHTLCGDESFVPDIVFRSAEYDVLPGLVEAGIGITLIAQLGCDDLRTTQAIRIAHPAARRRIVAVYRKSCGNPLLPPMLSRLSEAGRRASRALYLPVGKPITFSQSPAAD
jgi:DNA-binding transcriptional LysR family regulator